MQKVANQVSSADLKLAMQTGADILGMTIHTPLLANRSYREMLVVGCKNSTTGISAYADNSGTLSYITKDAWSGGCTLHGVDPGQMLGTPFEVTAGDFIAQVSSDLPGAPPYCMIWPEKRRREAKQKLTQWLLDEEHDWLAIAKASPT